MSVALKKRYPPRKMRRLQEQRMLVFQQKLKTLHKVSQMLSKAPTFDLFCQQVIILGMRELGFDRLGLWFFDASTGMMQGTYGVDENGNIRDERHLEFHFSSSNMITWMMHQKLQIGYYRDAPLYNDVQEVVGFGWHACAMMLDGEDIIGWLSADNFFNHRPLTQEDVELLALYGSIVGQIAARHRVLETLEQERNLLRIIIDTLPDSIFVKDAEGRILQANKACLDGAFKLYQMEDALGRTLFDFMPHDLAAQYALTDQQVIESGEAQYNIEETYPLDGGVGWLLTTKVPLRNAQGAVMGVLGISRDVTENRLAQAQLLDLELHRRRVQFFTDFITNFSHDFRTPLSIINTSLYFLTKAQTPEVVQQKAPIIAHQVNLLERYIDDIMMVSRLENTTMTPQYLDLAEVVNSVLTKLQPLADEKQVTWTVQLEDEQPYLQGDSALLNRGITNIISNAVMYTIHPSEVTVRAKREDQWYVLSICDQGVGMQTDQLSRIFEPFYRIDPARGLGDGTGLGLPIARQIVALHDGRITVESKHGIGTTVRIWLPIVTPIPQKRDQYPNNARPTDRLWGA